MKTNTTLPAQREMYRALCERNDAYEGVFVAGIRSTGIFCRPTCAARKPLEKNTEYFANPGDALRAGYRPCKRCRPIEPRGTVPDWLRPVLDAVEQDPARRWKDGDLRAMGIDPARVRRWFQVNHGMTFHGYQRARRLGLALGRIRRGEDLTNAAYEHGYESVSGFREAFASMFGATPGKSRHAKTVTLMRLLTPLGPMVAGAVDEGICLLEFADRRMLEAQFGRIKKLLGRELAPGNHMLIDQLDEELQRYFKGELREFSVPMVYPGTKFQVACWDHLRTIPYGETRSYGELARSLDKPSAVRAVGRANGDNRLAILLPCHRVVGADGKLTGYGGGLWRKQHLLALEAAHEPQLWTPINQVLDTHELPGESSGHP